MEQPSSKYFRLFGIALTSRGFGFAAIEGKAQLIAFGNKGVKGNKNAHSITKVERLLNYYRPDVMVLLDVNAKEARRALRVKSLHREILELAARRKLKVTLISGQRVRSSILGKTSGTKHELAKALVDIFPDQLASKLPSKRRAWESEDVRMDTFEGVGLAVAFRASEK